jgi:hypothetical protein
MMLPQLQSSAIREVHYDASHRHLFVTFKNGRRYAYFDAPPELYERFLHAPSRGEFFNAEVRDRYRFREVMLAVQ